MITFKDGPADGVVLALRRAPLFLRVVIDPDGTVDALDQLDDRPKRSETIHVYRLISEATRYHMRCKRRSESGWYWSADYGYVPEPQQPDDAIARDNNAWREWCTTPAGEPLTPNKVKHLVQELRGTRCRCGKVKVAKQTFCRACYYSLSPAQRSALYRPIRGGYSQAYDDAVATLDGKQR